MKDIENKNFVDIKKKDEGDVSLSKLNKFKAC